MVIFPIRYFSSRFFLRLTSGIKKRGRSTFKFSQKNRQNESICTFTRHFEYREIDTWVIRAVYEQLQDYMSSEKESFPIRPTDDVFVDLKIDEEDFECDLVEQIAQRSGRSLEEIENQPILWKSQYC